MATQNVWKKLFPTIQVIECLLHAFVKVRGRATKKMEAFSNQQQIEFGMLVEQNQKSN
jgi:hypothetical protein